STEFREAGILIYSNRSIQGSIRVRQNYDPGPPDPPEKCVANPIETVVLGPFSEFRTLTVTYENPVHCSGTTYLKHPYDVVPGWLTITPSGNSFTLYVGDNSS